MKTVFYARTDPDYKFLRVNEHLKREDPKYIRKYGEVGSDKWWKHYDKNKSIQCSLCLLHDL